MSVKYLLELVRVGFAAAAMALTIGGHAHAAGNYPVCSSTPTPSDVEAAKGMHQAAKQFYAKARYDRAIQSWIDAYNFDCNAHGVLINIGNAYEKLGQTAKAIDAFETYVERAGDKADPTIADKVNNLKRLLADQNQPQPTPIGTSTAAPTSTAGGETAPAPPSGGPGMYPWIVVGAGGAAVVAGVILLAVGGGKINDAESICPVHNTCTDPTAQDLGNQGLTMQRAGGVVLGVGVAAAAGGVLWYFLGNRLAKSASANAKPVAAGVMVGPGFSGLSLSGTF